MPKETAESHFKLAACSNCGEPVWWDGPGFDWLHETTDLRECEPAVAEPTPGTERWVMRDA